MKRGRSRFWRSTGCGDLSRVAGLQKHWAQESCITGLNFVIPVVGHETNAADAECHRSFPPFSRTCSTLEKRGHRLVSASNLKLIEVGLSVVALWIWALGFHHVGICPSLRPTNDVLDDFARKLLSLIPLAVVLDDLLVGACSAFKTVAVDITLAGRDLGDLEAI